MDVFYARRKVVRALSDSSLLRCIVKKGFCLNELVYEAWLEGKDQRFDEVARRFLTSCVFNGLRNTHERNLKIIEFLGFGELKGCFIK